MLPLQRKSDTAKSIPANQLLIKGGISKPAAGWIILEFPKLRDQPKNLTKRYFRPRR
jgi:hypothetical protein